LYSSIVKQFEDSITRFQEVQSEIKSFMQNQILRDAEIVMNKKLDDKEREEILNNPEVIYKFIRLNDYNS